MRRAQKKALILLAMEPSNALDSRTDRRSHVKAAKSRQHSQFTLRRRNSGFIGIDTRLKAPGPAMAQRSRGMTLIEIMVAVALSSLLMGLAISLAVAIIRYDRNVSAFAVHSDRLSDLAAALRSDLRQAAAAWLPSLTTLAIKLPEDREILYEVDSIGCRRLVSAAGQSPAQSELFAVGAAEAWTLDEAAPGRRPLIKVIMHFEKRGKEKASRPAPLLVYAALGADLPNTIAPMDQSNGNDLKQQKEDVVQEETEEEESEDIE